VRTRGEMTEEKGQGCWVIRHKKRRDKDVTGKGMDPAGGGGGRRVWEKKTEGGANKIKIGKWKRKGKEGVKGGISQLVPIGADALNKRAKKGGGNQGQGTGG